VLQVRQRRVAYSHGNNCNVRIYYGLSWSGPGYVLDMARAQEATDDHIRAWRLAQVRAEQEHAGRGCAMAGR
jgi:hypothetical protein